MMFLSTVRCARHTHSLVRGASRSCSRQATAPSAAWTRTRPRSTRPSPRTAHSTSISPSIVSSSLIVSPLRRSHTWRITSRIIPSLRARHCWSLVRGRTLHPLIHLFQRLGHRRSERPHLFHHLLVVVLYHILRMRQICGKRLHLVRHFLLNRVERNVPSSACGLISGMRSGFPFFAIAGYRLASC